MSNESGTAIDHRQAEVMRKARYAARNLTDEIPVSTHGESEILFRCQEVIVDIVKEYCTRNCRDCINLYTPKAEGFKHQCSIGVSNTLYMGRGCVTLDFGCNSFRRREA